MAITTAAKPQRLCELRARLAKWLSIPVEDEEMVDFALAVYKSHEIPGDPLWAIIIDASGAGKTELLRAFRKRKDSYFLSKFTEKSLVSGYRDPKHPEKDPSLLLELNEKILVIKDLSPLLSMREDSRKTIIGDLRDAYDGFSDQGRGNLGRVNYEARFTLLCASTLAVEQFSSVEQELGERFVKLRSRGNGGLNKTRKAIANIGSDNQMRQEIESSINGFLDSLPRIVNTRIPESLQEPLAQLSDFTAKTRSHVQRDRNGDLQYLPKPEVGTRLGKELGKLLMSLASVRGKREPDAEDFDTVIRVAEDCLPPNRLSVIAALRERPMRPVEIQEATGLPPKTATRILDDLRVIGLVEKTPTSDEKVYLWSLVNDSFPAPKSRSATTGCSGFKKAYPEAAYGVPPVTAELTAELVQVHA
jgi:hypothetical protein